MLEVFTKLFNMRKKKTLFPNLRILHLEVRDTWERLDVDSLTGVLSATISKSTERILFNGEILAMYVPRVLEIARQFGANLSHLQIHVDWQDDWDSDSDWDSDAEIPKQNCLKALTDIPSLRSISIPGSLPFTSLIKALSKMPHLQTLDLTDIGILSPGSESYGFTPEVTSTLPRKEESDASYSSLQSLHLWSVSTKGYQTFLRDSGFTSQIPRCQLQNLRIQMDDSPSVEISNSIPIHFPDIIRLHLEPLTTSSRSASLAYEHVSPLAGCRKLTSLTLVSCILTSKELLLLIKEWPNLTTLEVVSPYFGALCDEIRGRTYNDKHTPILTANIVGPRVDCLESIAGSLPMLEHLTLTLFAGDEAYPLRPRHTFSKHLRSFTMVGSFINYEHPGFLLYETAKYMSFLVGPDVKVTSNLCDDWDINMDSGDNRKRYRRAYEDFCSLLGHTIRNLVRFRMEELPEQSQCASVDLEDRM